MLHLTLFRKWKNTEYTIGQLFAGGRLICNTVEDSDRGLNMYMKEAEIKRIKIQNETAIPVGTYKLAVSVSTKFKRKLIEVLNVPGYSGIRFHKGNTAKDSAGCIIPGENKVKGGVINSTHYEELLTSMVESALNNKEETYLTII